ncbi:hypothetical protein [Paenirhodobacter populi]|uniref:Uncharacterized protein n=1 Tax=Paenirhodobacter populi TaxID=2306993 RepID=A0A443ISA5_9RHOB|nr:hypothetical protein [Sinirhodobacter populi]RWR09564.1 hypothetical protein D2T33_14020 [Sinirhodobacter populi]
MSIAGPNRPQAGMRGLGWLLPVMLGGAIMQGSTGLLHTIVPLRMTFKGFETRMIGLVGSAYARGFGACCCQQWCAGWARCGPSFWRLSPAH